MERPGRQEGAAIVAGGTPRLNAERPPGVLDSPPMRALLLLLVPVLLLLGPSIWVQVVLRRHARQDPTLPGTGGELAAHLLRFFQLSDVRLEVTAQGDHYDPEARVVRLSKANMDGRSLTAVATAAHEVGHALQHAMAYPPLLRRTALARQAMSLQRFASLMFILSPLILLLARSPVAALALAGVALATVLLTTLIHLVTLPVEFDASFNRALPILRDRHWLRAEELATVRSILLACALTYVSQSILALLTLRFWLRALAR